MLTILFLVTSIPIIVLTIVGEILASPHVKQGNVQAEERGLSLSLYSRSLPARQPVTGAAGTGLVPALFRGILKITNEQVEQVFVGDYVGDVYSLFWWFMRII